MRCGRVGAIDSTGWSPLYTACNAGFLEAARVLLDAGADPNARNDEGYSPLGRVPGTCPELRELVAARGGRV